MLNSWISDCKAVGQDTQALGGYNGPGNYLIENNYLEAATENVLFGGADPPIPESGDDEHHVPAELSVETDRVARSDCRDARRRHRRRGARQRHARRRHVLLQSRRARSRQGRPTPRPPRPRPKCRRRLRPGRPAASRSHGHRWWARPITSCSAVTPGSENVNWKTTSSVLHRHGSGGHERRAGIEHEVGGQEHLRVEERAGRRSSKGTSSRTCGSPRSPDIPSSSRRATRTARRRGWSCSASRSSTTSSATRRAA